MEGVAVICIEPWWASIGSHSRNGRGVAEIVKAVNNKVMVMVDGGVPATMY